MRILIVLLTWNLTLSSQDFLTQDKKYHTLAGTGIYLGCLFFSGIAYNNNVEWLNAKTCLVPVYAAAIGKEIYDAQGYGTADFADTAATVFIPTTGYIIYEW